MAETDFYVRYYVGHKGKFGHEFLEFELRPDGKVSARNAGTVQNPPPLLDIRVDSGGGIL
jgi:hypothetical protein